MMIDRAVLIYIGVLFAVVGLAVFAVNQILLYHINMKEAFDSPCVKCLEENPKYSLCDKNTIRNGVPSYDVPYINFSFDLTD